MRIDVAGREAEEQFLGVWKQGWLLRLSLLIDLLQDNTTRSALKLLDTGEKSIYNRLQTSKKRLQSQHFD